jgi:hypothetical protein
MLAGMSEAKGSRTTFQPICKVTSTPLASLVVYLHVFTDQETPQLTVENLNLDLAGCDPYK